MPALLVVSALAGVVMAGAVVALVRPVDRTEVLLRAGVATLLACAATVTFGLLTNADTPEFLIAASFATAPVVVLLGAAAAETAPGEQRVARMLVLGWAGVVFPVAAVVPAVLFQTCDAPECRVEDFGDGLALLVSSAASVLLAWSVRHVEPERGWAGFVVPVLVLWAAGAVWLASLEGALDAYIPRILLAAVLSPVGGALGWLLVDLLRQSPRHPLRSAADGLVAGLVAIVPGVATLSFPWSMVVGALAGAVAALVYGARRLASAGRAAHWALVVLASTAIGYLAPAVSGDTIGLLFSGRIGGLVPPVLAFLTVAAFGLVTSVPAWLMRRRRRGGADG